MAPMVFESRLTKQTGSPRRSSRCIPCVRVFSRHTTSCMAKAATEMLAGHSQRSHTLMTNYIRVDNRISLTAGTTDEGPPVVPQTAAANQ